MPRSERLARQRACMARLRADRKRTAFARGLFAADLLTGERARASRMRAAK